MSNDWKSQYGPWAVVTGASDGLGKAIAEALAAKGVNLVLVARRVAVLNEVANDYAKRYGVETQVIATDLSQLRAVDDVLTTTEDLPVGLLVASAGFGTSGRFIDIPLEDELIMLDVICRAVVAMTHHFARRFAARGRGGIILLSSLVGFQGVARAAHYAATKAYIQSLAEGLRIELAPLGVDVLASAPGPVHSGFADRANMQMSMALKPETVARDTLNALGKQGTVRPGFLTKFLDGSLSLLPRWGRVRVMSMVMGGMTADDAEPTTTPTSA